MLELTAYQRSRLAADEQVFWCGKTRPVARFAAWPLFVVFGVVACAMAMFSPFLRSVWWLVRKDGTPTAVKIGFALFALPFVGVALGFLLSPLWHWIYTRGSVWVITDRRVIRFFGPFAKSWGYDKLFEYVEWSSAGHGCRVRFADVGLRWRADRVVRPVERHDGEFPFGRVVGILCGHLP